MPPKDKRTDRDKQKGGPGRVATLNDDGGWGWCILIGHDGTLRVYRLPQVIDPGDTPDEFGSALVAARKDAGMPADADPIDSGWDVSTGPGEPHRRTLARSTLVDWSAGVPA